MSREIKFRAWDKDKIKYVDGVGNLYMDILETGTNVFEIAQMCPGRYVIEQYTGFKDKNGKEIYEGDIIQEEVDFDIKMADGAFRYEVYWDSDMLTWSLNPLNAASVHAELWETNMSREVISNIHENPELLEDD